MKKISRILALSVLGVFLLAGTAMAYTYSDDYANWPGYPINPADVIGTPRVGDMTITTDVSGNLQLIKIEVSERQVWDSLFINADWNGSDYETWDYYVRDDTLDDNTDGSFYAVSSEYDYLYATNPGGWTGRWGHPAGIEPDDLTSSSGLTSVVWDRDLGVLTYSFDGTINIGEERGICYRL